MTELTKKKQKTTTPKTTLAVTLSLSGQAREKVLQIPANELEQDTGMDKLIAELNSLFKKETIDLSYEAYLQFERFKKEYTMDMADFIVEFETAHVVCKV